MAQCLFPGRATAPSLDSSQVGVRGCPLGSGSADLPGEAEMCPFHQAAESHRERCDMLGVREG